MRAVDELDRAIKRLSRADVLDAEVARVNARLSRSRFRWADFFTYRPALPLALS